MAGNSALKVLDRPIGECSGRTKTQRRNQRTRKFEQLRRDAAHFLVLKAEAEPDSPERLQALEWCSEILQALVFHVATEGQLKKLLEEYPQLHQISLIRSPSE